MARLDKYLAKLNGETESAPAPVSALDKQMAELANNPPKELPDTSEASVGDILILDEDKAPAWTTPSGGRMLILDETNLTLVTLNDIGATVVYYDGSEEVIITPVAVYNGDISDLLSRPFLVDDNCVLHNFL